MKKVFVLTTVLAAIYITSYLVLRNTHSEIWDKDGKAYVIFPKEQVWMYYLYRPMSYIDGKLTGMGFHIGPHN